MKKLNLKNLLRDWKKASLTAVTTLAASFIFGISAYPVVATAEESVAPRTVTLDVTVKETQDVYSIALSEDENGSYTAVCEADDSFAYEVAVGDGITTVSCAGLSVDGEWTYELSYSFVETAEGEDNENVLSVTNGADVIGVKISFGTAIIDFDAYLEGEEKTDLSATLSEDCTQITVATQNNKAVAASDVMTVKIIIPDNLLVEDFENTLEIAQGIIIPKIYIIVGVIVLVALVILGFSMLFVAG